MSLTFEVVTSAPVEAIVELYRAAGWWKEAPGWREAIPAMVRGSFRFMLVRDGERVVGMARVISDGVSDAYIQDVTVLPEWRGRGAGRELVRRLTDLCLEARISWIGLVAEPGTTAFYEALGFGELSGYRPMLFGHPGAGGGGREGR